MFATFATSGMREAVHGWTRSHEMKSIANALMVFRFECVKNCAPRANVVTVSSSGPVWKSVSPRMVKRTTALVSTRYARIPLVNVQPSF
jgi:hypothetical protein